MTDLSRFPTARLVWLATALFVAGCGGEEPGASGTAGTGGGMAGSAGGRGGTGPAGGSGGTTTNGGTGGGVAGTGGGTGGAVTCTATDGGVGGSGSVLPDSVSFLPNVTVTTLAGSATAGAANGAGTTATFANPVGVALETGGSLIVADFNNSLLRRVAADGTTSTLTTQATFVRPYGVGFAGGVLYAETDQNPSGQRNASTGTIWRIDTTSGAATAVAPDLGRPRAFAPLSDGRLVLSDVSNARLRLLNVTSGAVTDLAGLANCVGSSNGTGPNARFMNPAGVVVLTGNRIIVADTASNILREVTTAGVVTTFAGDGVAGTIDGPRASARFNGPRALAADASGAIFVSDTGGVRIRRIDAAGTVTTVAGDGTGGFQDGPGNTAQFFGQEGLAASADGITVYVADGDRGSDTLVPYHRIRKITIAP